MSKSYSHHTVWSCLLIFPAKRSCLAKDCHISYFSSFNFRVTFWNKLKKIVCLQVCSVGFERCNVQIIDWMQKIGDKIWLSIDHYKYLLISHFELFESDRLVSLFYAVSLIFCIYVVYDYFNFISTTFWHWFCSQGSFPFSFFSSFFLTTCV